MPASPPVEDQVRFVFCCLDQSSVWFIGLLYPIQCALMASSEELMPFDQALCPNTRIHIDVPGLV